MKYILLIAVLTLGNNLRAQDIALTIISHPEGCPSTLNETELISILKGEKQRWRSGAKIRIALMKTNTPIGKTTCSKIYKMNEDQLKKYWLGLVFQGKAEAPDFFTNIGDLQAFILEHPGAIGIIDGTDPVSGIQVVSVNGNLSL